MHLYTYAPTNENIPDDGGKGLMVDDEGQGPKGDETLGFDIIGLLCG